MSAEDYTPIFKLPVYKNRNKKRPLRNGLEISNTFTSRKSVYLNRVNVVIFGFGLIGRKLVERIVACRDLHKSVCHLQHSVNAIFDSQGYIYNGDALGNATGLSDGTLIQAIEWKQKQNSLRVFRDAGYYMNDFEVHFVFCFFFLRCKKLRTLLLFFVVMQRMRVNLLSEKTILVDCTNCSDELEYAFTQHSKKGGGVVFANKKPLWPRVHRFGYSAALGGSSQFINTISNLINSGDTIWYLEGIVSSFWNYVLSNYKCGSTRFSDLCVEAHKKGLSMSDIREDLAGLDLARTLLKCFYDMIPIELFWNPNINVYDFMKHLRSLDHSIDQYLAQKQSANSHGKGNLRCIVKMNCETETLAIDIESINEDSEYQMAKNDMCALKIYTDVYKKENNEHLFITGKGAGPDVTVNGVLMDLNRVAYVMDNDTLNN
ncbi:hypothetical protein RFI_11201 [Reticulomyxa filosa]|uniref:Homoserine dehydrogenase catalytic domain-containing protein n=1 Tax=Reticulomyxa filosa TaxID=46433 RepID=X6NI07_RETFI|nr:hypothetical protein RFI_11201 [Reticulomyxa filosa]|eukprot:ETO25935.1 hypothetical protein RFI_11201 [Reticulomyxa filosa]